MAREKTYYLGCPMWSNKAWRSTFFSRGSKPADYLGQYAGVFGSVEGNTTFYALPKREVVANWARVTPATFRFTFKFPRVISHDLALRETAGEVARFYEVLAPLAERVGCLFLQLPPHFCDLDRLARFLASLPHTYHVAVEVRHAALFGRLEEDLVALLTQFGADQVIFDTQRLMGTACDDPGVLGAQRRKPKMPTRYRALGPKPFVRFVGRPDYREDSVALAHWAEVVAGWIKEGRTPYVFMHQVPDDDDAPQLCRFFHELVRARLPGMEAMADFPSAGDEPLPQQLSLF